jgi:hypothetical protein
MRCSTFCQPTVNDEDVLAGALSVIASEIYFQAALHIPTLADLPEMGRLVAEELLNLSSLCSQLILVEVHRV